MNINRRELLRIGALSVFGAASGASSPAAGNDRRGTHQAIYLMLQGGASHLDLWDPKPNAVSEIRGPFQSIPTSIPGVRLGELMKHTASIADKITIVRSMSHKFTNHIAGTYVTMTGSDNQPDRDREAHADDFPGPGAILNHLQTTTPSIPVSVSLPNWLSIPGPSNRMPGQYGGFLGSTNDPFIFEGDPNAKEYNPLSLNLPDGVTSGRLSDRLSLTEQLDNAARRLEKENGARLDALRHSAFDLIVDGRVRKALEIDREPDAVRDRYGRSKLGQSLLVARRLIEAGVQFVSYNEFNQRWDTHSAIENTYKNIVPPMEQAYAALIADLDERGLLDTTMVVNAGEFGRTPAINKDGGRDHWPNVYSIAVAGGKVKRGFVYGASDSTGNEVAESAVHPADVLATLWQHLDHSPRTIIHDRLGRPLRISEGRVLEKILI
jgi:hypothetical protein